MLPRISKYKSSEMWEGPKLPTQCTVLAAFVATVAAANAAAPQRPTTPQNVLLIISDDLRAEIDAVGFVPSVLVIFSSCL
jgi:hypothetical protein